LQKNIGLLIIDVQKGFINEHTKHIPEQINSLQNNSLYKAVFASRFINVKASPFRRWMNWERFSRNSEDSELAFDVSKRVKIFEKYTYSCLTKDLLEGIEHYQLQEMHLCGLDTNMCVFITATRLFEEGLCMPVVLKNYCASHSGKAYHEAGLICLSKAIGKDLILSNAL
jgi:nicotinamidase-related amidase